MPKSPSFCGAKGPRKKGSRKMPARTGVAVVTGFLLCILAWFAGELFSQGKGGATALQISSPAFSAGETIPKKVTCDGPDVSPQLKWNEPAANAQGFALIMDDPDAPAGTWVHWVLYDVRLTRESFPKARRSKSSLPAARGKGETTSARSDMAGRVLRLARHTGIFSSCMRSIPDSI